MLISYFLANIPRAALASHSCNMEEICSLPPNMKYDVRCGLSYRQDGRRKVTFHSSSSEFEGYLLCLININLCVWEFSPPSVP